MIFKTVYMISLYIIHLRLSKNMLAVSFYNTDNQRPQIISVFYINIKNQLNQDNISSIFSIIQEEIYEPYIESGKIKVYETLPVLQEVLGESANVTIDLNLDYYGPEYSESILTEWNTRKLVFHTSYGCDNYVTLEEEGSMIILYNMLQQAGMA